VTDLRLVAEYGCWPLWEVPETGISTNVDPGSLPIPTSLAEDLVEWRDAYERTLNDEYPPRSGFADSESAAAWLRFGSELAARLQAALANAGYRVEYAHAREAPARHVASRE
jgi:hypothetical protein